MIEEAPRQGVVVTTAHRLSTVLGADRYERTARRLTRRNGTAISTSSV